MVFFCEFISVCICVQTNKQKYLVSYYNNNNTKAEEEDEEEASRLKKPKFYTLFIIILN